MAVRCTLLHIWIKHWQIYCEGTWYKEKKLHDDMFSSQSPLSTFSSRIKFAYYSGKIDIEVRRDLDIIRSIRNDFAHHPESMSFDTQSVRDRYNNLKHIFNLEGRPRSKYTGAVCALLAKIHVGIIHAAPVDEKPFTTDMEKVRSEVQEHFETLQTALKVLTSPKNLDADG